MAQPEPATFSYFLAIVAGYLAACGGWVALDRLRPRLWPRAAPTTRRPWLDFALVFVAVVAILALGQAWRAGLLLPRAGGVAGDLLWTLNNLIIYAPLFVILAARRQSLATVYLAPDALPLKLAAGLVFGLLGVVVFLALYGELGRLPAVAAGCARRENLRNFIPVFLEGVVLAFAFVRLRWVAGLWPAVVIPSILFAAAHVPRQLAGDLGAGEMAAYFAVTALVSVAVLLVLGRSRDVIWLGIVHYAMDVAIGAF